MDIATNYTDAARYVDKARDWTKGRPIANNTRIIRRGEHAESGGSIAIRLHQTDVITLHENGDTEFNSGGWITVTTQSRMNMNERFSIYSTGRGYRERGYEYPGADPEWCVWLAGGWYGDLRPAGRMFHDGIRFNYKGECLTDTPTFGEVMDEYRAEMTERKRMNGKRLAFSNRVTRAFKEGMAANPLDCLPCRQGVEGHFDFHLEEGVPSAAMIFKAVEEYEYDPALGSARTILGLHPDPNGADILMGGQIERHYPTRAPRGRHGLSTDRGRPDVVRRAVRALVA